MKNKPDQREQFASAVRVLALCGFLTDIEEVAPCIWVGRHTGAGWSDVARELSCTLPGQCWHGARGVSWVCGRRKKHSGPSARIFDARDYSKVVQAQNTCKAIGALHDNPEGEWYLPWSIGAAARLLLEFVTAPSKTPTPCEHMTEGVKLGYHDCKPGMYPSAVMYDGAAYYYNLLWRLGTLKVSVTAEGFVMAHDMKGDGPAKFREMMQGVREDKVLRNSLVGCAMGKRGWQAFWVNDGKDKSKKGYRWSSGGPFRPAGLLVLRTGIELCQVAALQCDSVYSTIDSITALCQTKPFAEPPNWYLLSESEQMIMRLQADRALEAEVQSLAPKVWKQYGIPHEIKAYGRAHICSRGVWRISETATPTYRKRTTERAEIPAPSPPLPKVLYHQGWL